MNELGMGGRSDSEQEIYFIGSIELVRCKGHFNMMKS